MNRFTFRLGMAALVVLICAGAGSAQTTNLTVVSGNGQLLCQQCAGPVAFTVQPFVVKVTNAAGQPVSNAAVTWAITAGGGSGNLAGDTSYSDQNGLASMSFFAVTPPIGTPQNLFLQTTITATSGASSAAFTLTQGLQQNSVFTGGSVLPPIQVSVAPGGRDLTTGSALTGQAGTTGTPPIKILVSTTFSNSPIPNVSVFIYNDPNTPGGTVQCATQSGAGTNTVLTDATGVATCNPVFGGVPNVNGNAFVYVGGSYPLEHFTTDPTAPPTALYQFPGAGALVVRVTPAAPGALRMISGSPQSAQAGQALAAPLVVRVETADGTALEGQAVDWRLSPATAGTLGSASTVTDASGQTRNTVTFASTASGSVQAIATLHSDLTKTFTFNLTAVPLVTVTGLQIVSGNNQSALANAAFASPLVVQLNATGGAAAGVPVQFTVTGPAAVLPSTVSTGSTGQAAVTVRAGATAGAVTITATAAGFSQTFNLTVSPPGPTLLTSSFLNGADFQRGALGPCSIATIIATGLAPGLQGMVSGNFIGPLPYVVANDRVTVGGIAAPIYSVGLNANGQEQLTFQVPCDVTPGSSVPVVVNVGSGSGTVNIPIQAASPGIFLTPMSDGVSRAVLVRPDGSYVSVQNPARRGENLVAFVTGLGPAAPAVGTNSVAAPGSMVTPQGTVIVGMAGGGVPLVSTQLSPDLVGVWLVTFTVPTTVNAGNITFSMSVIPAGSSNPISSGGTTIPVQ